MFPKQRKRRLRNSDSIRKIVSEINLTVNDLVTPIFLTEGEKVKEEIRKTPQKSRNNTEKPLISLKRMDIPSIETLKGVDNLTDLPLHAYSYETNKEKDIITKLKNEIKRLKDDKAKS